MINMSKRKRGSSSKPSVAENQIMVNGHSQEWLRRNFDWVYDKEVLARGAESKPGQVITLLDKSRKILGTGIAGQGDIAVRRFSLEECILDMGFFAERAEQALMRRRIPEQTTAWRWIHAENDDLPGIRVDVWGADISIILSCPSLQTIISPLIEGLRKIRPFYRVWGHLRKENGKQSSLGLLWGERAGDGLWVTELGLQFWVTPQQSRDAGLFSDMRGLREWLTPHWKERRFLNLFCYTGAFTVSALANGATEAYSVDLSPVALKRVQKNLEHNGLSATRHIEVEGDAFQVLDRYRRKKEGFDVVLADPPSFSHSNQGVWSVQKDLRRLVTACLRVLLPGGWLIIATNHGKMSPREFSKAIVEASVKENRRVRMVYNYCPPTDFPAALHFPESRYLKCWVMQA